MNTVVIAGYVRTPFHFANKGLLSGVRPDDLAAITLKALVERTGLDPALIEDVLMGCAYPEAAQGNNIARIASLLAGLPCELGGATINRFCGSSMYAIHAAAGQIAIGAGEVFIAAGVESMTMVPQGGFNFSANSKFSRGDGSDAEIDIEAYISMGSTAENVADRYGITRAEQDAFAVLSQRKASRARDHGLLQEEIVSVTREDGTIVEEDGCLRPGTSEAVLAGLKPAFRDTGSVTAGTSSPLTDGAVAVLVTTEKVANRYNFPIYARVASAAIAGVEPEYMGLGPIPASRKALQRAGIDASELSVVEINEAFASQSIACLRELEIDPSIVNLHGGALAIGHPLGATGARITAKAAKLLREAKGRYALATQCIGGGQGIATVLDAG